MKGKQEVKLIKTCNRISILLVIPADDDQYYDELEEKKLSAYYTTTAASLLDSKWVFEQGSKDEPFVDIETLTNNFVCPGFTDLKRISGKFYRPPKTTTKNDFSTSNFYDISFVPAFLRYFGNTKYGDSVVRYKQTCPTTAYFCQLFDNYFFLHHQFYPFEIARIQHIYKQLECVRINNFSITTSVGSNNSAIKPVKDDGDSTAKMKPDISKAMKMETPMAKQCKGYVKVIPEENDSKSTLEWIGTKYVT